MLGAVVAAITPPCFAIVRAATNNERPSQTPKSPQRHKSRNASGFSDKKKDPVWQCVQKCGACCKLEKGPCFPTPDEIFDDPSDVQLFKSLVGRDGWCRHYDKTSRECSIYADRPYFCRVEPEVFDTLYGIDHRKFNKEACSCCIDTIKAVYGTNSEELERFNHAIWIDRTEITPLLKECV